MIMRQIPDEMLALHRSCSSAATKDLLRHPVTRLNVMLPEHRYGQERNFIYRIDRINGFANQVAIGSIQPIEVILVPPYIQRNSSEGLFV